MMMRELGEGENATSRVNAAASVRGHPPVFVMNPYYSGLGIARCLHARDVQIFALCSEQSVPGARSRYFDGVYRVPNGRDDPEGLCTRLLTIAEEHGQKPVIFPTRDFDVLFLHRYRATLASRYLLPQPEQSPILRMMDKSELATVAGQLNIPTPKTAVCISSEDIERQLSVLRFPVIVKPRFAHQWRHHDNWARVGAQKAFIVESADDLRALYARLATVNQEVLLQEFVPGVDSDIVVCCCYVARDGEMLGQFTGRKLRQSPALVGTGSVVEATEVPSIVAPSEQLLRAFGYSGIAEIEYKYDKATDTYFLIEINPRHWDQHELGTLVGVNITWLAYADMVGLQRPRILPSYVPGTEYKWISESELTMDVARHFRIEMRRSSGTKNRLRKTTEIVRCSFADLRDLLAGKRIFSLWRISDPLPGVLMFIGLMTSALRALRRPRPKSSHEDSHSAIAP